ncbi:RNA-directed DNA polymerase, eukaryota, reverse transcriptase zinc-binding domain protein, partial [Tanacetum coccineum]
GADAFNLFISNAGLEEVPLAITLDRYFSDHRPILMRESHYDYGPVPFSFFHYWFEMEGFDKPVEESWKEAPVADTNALIKIMKKLKYLKEKIRVWNKSNKESPNNSKRKLKAKLAELDSVIDKGVMMTPISIIGSIYKLIVKILANRLVVVLGNLVNEVQLAFVADRQILDGLFILNGLFQWSKWCAWIQNRLRSSRGSVIMKSACLVPKSGGCIGITLGSSLLFSHMFYADDAIFVGQWNESNINPIIHVLDCFHRASGLRINMSKSKLMGISVDADKVDKQQGKLVVLLLKPVYLFRFEGSMSIYHMSIFKVPMKVLQRMKSIRSHLFNRVEFVGKKPIWVKWKNVLALKDKGDLGVSSLYALNEALMFKWVWRFFTQSSSLWARVIKAIHEEDGKIGKKAKSSSPSIWLDIVHEVELFKDWGTDLVSFIYKKLGNGANTSFWEDAWRGGTAFKCLYPKLYALELWFDLMLANVEGTSLVDMRDRWVWSLEGSGEFSVASVRKLIDDNMLSEVASKTRWIKTVPIKVNVHAWKVKLDCLPTRLNISCRGMDIESILCPMCGEAA